MVFSTIDPEQSKYVRQKTLAFFFFRTYSSKNTPVEHVFKMLLITKKDRLKSINYWPES